MCSSSTDILPVLTPRFLGMNHPNDGVVSRDHDTNSNHEVEFRFNDSRYQNNKNNNKTAALLVGNDPWATTTTAPGTATATATPFLLESPVSTLLESSFFNDQKRPWAFGSSSLVVGTGGCCVGVLSSPALTTANTAATTTTTCTDSRLLLSLFSSTPDTMAGGGGGGDVQGDTMAFQNISTLSLGALPPCTTLVETAAAATPSTNTTSGGVIDRDIPATVTVIRFNNFNSTDVDDDEVSLLADNPDEDDVDVLPHSTYDVLANIFDEMYKDDSEVDDGC